MTIAYIATACVVNAVFYLCQKGGFITKDSFQVVTVVTTILTVGTYMLWLCAWMHQLHPLITPVWKGESSDESAAAVDDLVLHKLHLLETNQSEHH